MKGQRKGSG